MGRKINLTGPPRPVDKRQTVAYLAGMPNDPSPIAADLLRSLPLGSRVLGIDLGSKTIGLALSDTSRTIATPLETIRRSKFAKDSARLADICTAHEIQAIILGLPLSMDGTEGPRVQSTRAFARNIAGIIHLPIAFWDERLSTAAVTRTLLEADRSRKRRAELVDKLAASYILQGALDSAR